MKNAIFFIGYNFNCIAVSLSSYIKKVILVNLNCIRLI